MANQDTERPNWGWGANEPVRMYTEEQIRAVMADHRPGNEGSCLCSWKIGHPDVVFTADHLIEVLQSMDGNSELDRGRDQGSDAHRDALDG